MILTTHALTGAVIGKNISSIPLIIILSIIVHFLMDHLRHGEYVETLDSETGLKKSGWKIALDIAVAVLIVFSLIRLKDAGPAEIQRILLGSFFSMFPDLITFLYWLFPKAWFLESYYKFNSWVHKFPRHAPERQWTLQNARNDILISSLALIILLFF